VKKKTQDSYSSHIGARLKLLRSKLNYKQDEMAGRIGVSLGGYKKYEVGQRLPSLPAQHRLSKEFDLSMDWLLFNKGPMYCRDKNEFTELQQENLQLKGQLEQAEVQRRDLEEAHSKELEDQAARLRLPPELKELIDTMNKNDVLYYEILAHFKRFIHGSSNVVIHHEEQEL
jgi:transcriptional regulator with XRE-family HTH domain